MFSLLYVSSVLETLRFLHPSLRAWTLKLSLIGRWFLPATRKVIGFIPSWIFVGLLKILRAYRTRSLPNSSLGHSPVRVITTVWLESDDAYQPRSPGIRICQLLSWSQTTDGGLDYRDTSISLLVGWYIQISATSVLISDGNIIFRRLAEAGQCTTSIVRRV